MLYAYKAIGSRQVPLTPNVASKLYWGAVIPKICYGVEICNICDESILQLGKFHFWSSKQIQGLSDNCPNYGSLITCNWMTLQAHLDIIRLLFTWRILLLPMNIIYKKGFYSSFHRSALSE